MGNSGDHMTLARLLSRTAVMAVRLFLLAICLVIPMYQSHGSDNSLFHGKEQWPEYRSYIQRQFELQKNRKRQADINKKWPRHRPRIQSAKYLAGNIIPLEIFSRNKLWIHVRQKDLQIAQIRIRRLQAEKRRKSIERQKLEIQKRISERTRSDRQRLSLDKQISPPSRRDTLRIAELNRTSCHAFFGIKSCISTAGADIKDCFQTSVGQFECLFKPVVTCRADEGGINQRILESACPSTEWNFGQFRKVAEGWKFERSL